MPLLVSGCMTWFILCISIVMGMWDFRLGNPTWFKVAVFTFVLWTMIYSVIEEPIRRMLK